MNLRREDPGGEVTACRPSDGTRAWNVVTGLIGTALVALLLPCASNAGPDATPVSASTDRVASMPMVENEAAETIQPEPNDRLARRRKGPSWYENDNDKKKTKKKIQKDKHKKKIKKNKHKRKKKVISPD